MALMWLDGFVMWAWWVGEVGDVGCGMCWVWGWLADWRGAGADGGGEAAVRGGMDVVVGWW